MRGLPLPKKLHGKPGHEQPNEGSEVSRRMPHPDPAQGQGIVHLSVHAKIQCDGGFVSSLLDEIPDPTVPLSVGVAKMSNLSTEQVLQLFLR